MISRTARLTVALLSAYFSNNNVPSDNLAELIETTRSALAGTMAAARDAPAAKPQPAVSVEESTASRDHLISLIDGKPYKSLKRHLANNGLTPVQYRQQYDLPADYPLVAPSYSEHRRAVAKRMGLGGKAKEPSAAKAPGAAEGAIVSGAAANKPNNTAPASSPVKPAGKKAGARQRTATKKSQPAAAQSAPAGGGAAEAAKREAPQAPGAVGPAKAAPKTPPKAAAKGNAKRRSARMAGAPAVNEAAGAPVVEATVPAAQAPSAKASPKRRTLKIRTAAPGGKD